MIITSSGKKIRRFMRRTRKSCHGFVTLLLVQFGIDPPFHLSSFSCAPSSICHFFLSWIQKWRSLLALTERGWRCLFIWRVLEPWLRRGGSGKADGMSAALVRGLSAGFPPAHEENKKGRMKKRVVVKLDSLRKWKKFTFWSSRPLFGFVAFSVSSQLS